MRKTQSSLGLRLAMRTASALVSLAWAPSRVAVALVGAPGRVTEVPKFGSNPGALKMFVYRPPGRLAAGAPLIVVLHGCGQDAAAFAENAGWLALAQALGAALVLPQQSTENNRGRCFNWFRPSDTRRGGGETLSIRQMVRTATTLFESDRRRVYVVGLSAGAALAVALLAAYPTVFAGGAAAAGVALGTAGGPFEALSRLRRANGHRSRDMLASVVRAAGPASRSRTWPRLSIWQGEGDRTVDPAHGEILAAQWSAVNGLDPLPRADTQPMPGVHHRVWGTARRNSVELWTIADMGHGFPVDAKTPGCGRPGPWVLDAGIPAARHIARFWGLEPAIA
ncbi:MAG TPA: PHB depolymerase family esterase [Aliidongia sp.]|uniref:extracellular catalytic domain type 1 short-chain-length polyhydroxyalkanoate depolymerase n=1 Tax=Aliidongia sp. TaxID=1914230 RepID=UPI002DDDB6A4|nr:PHB depolymerase family esterase [Aliidongia sp.]HEV2673885.1 PHB depolymerase family esterase [Aliidongia sp.]